MSHPQKAATPPTLARRFVELEAAIAALADRVVVLEDQARDQAADDRVLMRAILGAVGDAVFSAAELFDHQAVDRELQAVLRRYPTPKRIGKRLRAIANRPIAGFVLQRVGRDEHGTIWGLQVAPDLHVGSWPGENSSA